MRESARLPGQSVRAAAARQVRECLYSVLRREHGLHAHRVWQVSSATSRPLLFARSENGKYENDKLFRFPRRVCRGSLHPESIRSPKDRPEEETH